MEKEGKEYGDKDTFLTSAYRKKLEERKQMEEELRREEEKEGEHGYHLAARMLGNLCSKVVHFTQE